MSKAFQTTIGYIFSESSVNVIQLNDYNFAYSSGSFHLNIQEFYLAPGEVVFLHGRSGCGKTTLLNLLAGVIPSEVARMSRREFGSISYVMHESTLLPWLSIERNLAAEARLRRAEYSIGEFIGIARRLGLDEACLTLRPRQLSHGMRQRVEIAKALTFHAGLLLLDEGLSGIDTSTRLTVIRELWNIVSDRGLTIVATAHHVIDIVTFAQRVYLFDGGTVGHPLSFKENVTARIEMSGEELYRLDEASKLLVE